jgi:hypothetical protein
VSFRVTRQLAPASWVRPGALRDGLQGRGEQAIGEPPTVTWIHISDRSRRHAAKPSETARDTTQQEHSCRHKRGRNAAPLMRLSGADCARTNLMRNARLCLGTRAPVNAGRSPYKSEPDSRSRTLPPSRADAAQIPRKPPASSSRRSPVGEPRQAGRSSTRGPPVRPGALAQRLGEGPIRVAPGGSDDMRVGRPYPSLRASRTPTPG